MKVFSWEYFLIYKQSKYVNIFDRNNCLKMVSFSQIRRFQPKTLFASVFGICIVKSKNASQTNQNNFGEKIDH